jgi:hypothetical protein
MMRDHTLHRSARQLQCLTTTDNTDDTDARPGGRGNAAPWT